LAHGRALLPSRPSRPALTSSAGAKAAAGKESAAAAGDSNGAGPSAAGDADDTEEGEGEGDDGGPADDLQLAFENYEMARRIFERMVPDPQTRRRLADCLLLLGDVHMENCEVPLPLLLLLWLLLLPV
jgi:hypothetical protein